jgi:hypothetical protein
MDIVQARRGIGLTQVELQGAAGHCDCRDHEETGSNDDLTDEKGTSRIHSCRSLHNEERTPTLRPACSLPGMMVELAQ